VILLPFSIGLSYSANTSLLSKGFPERALQNKLPHLSNGGQDGARNLGAQAGGLPLLKQSRVY
jgi:hypothetical protein